MKSVFVLSLFVLLTCSNAFAMKTYLNNFKKAYPKVDARLGKCQLCHNQDGSNSLNPYGFDFAANDFDFKKIENVDSDGDTLNNIDELNRPSWPGDKNSPKK